MIKSRDSEHDIPGASGAGYNVVPVAAIAAVSCNCSQDSRRLIRAGSSTSSRSGMTSALTLAQQIGLARITHVMQLAGQQ